MTYYALATCLALAAFVLFNALGSLLAAGLWRALDRGARGWTAAARARVLFGLRVLPPAGALAFVAALLLPAFLTHEPYPAPDSVGYSLLALASLSATGAALALRRAAASWRATKRLTADWLRQAEPVRVEGVNVPAYRLRHPTPVIAVVGTLRPRLFIAEQLFSSLSREELKVALTHERGHLVARDTLKRAVLKFCRDLLPCVGAGRALDRAWAEEAERAADEYAARAGAAGALDLAAALIKIARMMPAGASHVLPAGAFLLEGVDGGIAGRVRRLTDMAASPGAAAGRAPLLPKVALPGGLAGALLGLAVASAEPQVLVAVHSFTEHAVRLLK